MMLLWKETQRGWDQSGLWGRLLRLDRAPPWQHHRSFPLLSAVFLGGHRHRAAGRWRECWAGASHSDAAVCSSPTTLEHPQQMSCHILCEVCTFSLDVRFISPSTRHIILFKVDFRSKKAWESEGILTPTQQTEGATRGTGATNVALQRQQQPKEKVNFGTFGKAEL